MLEVENISVQYKAAEINIWKHQYVDHTIWELLGRSVLSSQFKICSKVGKLWSLVICLHSKVFRALDRRTDRWIH